MESVSVPFHEHEIDLPRVFTATRQQSHEAAAAADDDPGLNMFRYPRRRGMIPTAAGNSSSWAVPPHEASSGANSHKSLQDQYWWFPALTYAGAGAVILGGAFLIWKVVLPWHQHNRTQNQIIIGPQSSGQDLVQHDAREMGQNQSSSGEEGSGGPIARSSSFTERAASWPVSDMVESADPCPIHTAVPKTVKTRKTVETPPIAIHDMPAQRYIRSPRQMDADRRQEQLRSPPRTTHKSFAESDESADYQGLPAGGTVYYAGSDDEFGGHH